MENLALAGIQSPVRPARSEYPGPTRNCQLTAKNFPTIFRGTFETFRGILKFLRFLSKPLRMFCGTIVEKRGINVI